MTSETKLEVDWLRDSKDIEFTRGVYSIHIKKFDGSHLGFQTWPKLNSVYPIGGMTSETKLEVDWLRDSKDIEFTRGVYSIHIKKFDGSHLGFRTWPKLNSVYPIGGMTSETKLEVDWLRDSKDIEFTRVSIAYILKSSIAAILVFAHGPKSIVSTFPVV